VPGLEKILDPGEGVAAPLETSDEFEPLNVLGSVEADTSLAARRRKDAHRLVLADGAHWQVRSPSELVDGQLVTVDPLRLSHGSTLPEKTVTVNAVTMSDKLETDLLAVLRNSTGCSVDLDYATSPVGLTGGFWAELVAFRLIGAPTYLSRDLVARVMPNPEVARKETIIQTQVARHGYPTPTVHLSGGPNDGLGRAFMVMDRVDGVPPLAGLEGVGALRRLPHLFARLPLLLATAMADLHRLDPALVRERMGDGDDGAWSVPELLEVVRANAAACGRTDLVAAVDWLVANPPSPSPEVICHGDLHPFNLLVDTAGDVTVLDWSAGLLAPRAYDAAFTSLVLAEPPIAVPRLAKPLLRMGGRALARRFLRAYRERSGVGVDDQSLRWHQSVVCLRALNEVAGWATADDLAAKAGHPWVVCGPAFALRVSRFTGVAVRPR
jgi:aminoglycoside phosphotransferase (APT) family kinase protein